MQKGYFQKHFLTLHKLLIRMETIIKPWQSGEIINTPDENWSTAWGGSENQWFASIFPRIKHYFPCKNMLEIACRHGRWSKFFLPITINNYVGIDYSYEAIMQCKDRFTEKKASFFQNDGCSLALADFQKYNFIFSFDYFVSCDLELHRMYIIQILDLLTEDGICFIHHSNFGEIVSSLSITAEHPGYIHGRDQTTSAETIKILIEELGGIVITQELINWGGDSLIDCFTLFSKKRNENERSIKKIINNNFMKEAETCINIFQSYIQ